MEYMKEELRKAEDKVLEKEQLEDQLKKSRRQASKVGGLLGGTCVESWITAGIQILLSYSASGGVKKTQ